MQHSAKWSTLCKRFLFEGLHAIGVSALVARSRWRQRRLLILCYHGISLEDEHEWCPGLYVPPLHFEERLKILQQSAEVVHLDEGLKRLALGTLPERSVAITFDDGFHDFYALAWPLLTKFGMPATVHLTTYYSEFRRPIFGLICSYMLWKRRGMVLGDLPISDWKGPVSLRTERVRNHVMAALHRHCQENHFSAAQKDNLGAKLAEQLGLDYEKLKARRILQIMSPEEVREIASSGTVSVQLHTHRHDMPRDWTQFEGEIQANRSRIEELTGHAAIHLAYPSNICGPEFMEWLQRCGVNSAATTQAGLVGISTHPLFMPRFVDQLHIDELFFRGWIGGVAAWLPKGQTQAPTGISRILPRPDLVISKRIL